MTRQSRMITGFLLLGALAVFTGSVLVLGYVVAAIAIATIVVLVLPPLAREIKMHWTTWRGRIARKATARRLRRSPEAARDRREAA